MSGGSYNYLCYKADESALELLESRGDVEKMLQRLRQLDYAVRAAQVTEDLLKDLDQLNQLRVQFDRKIEEYERKIKPKRQSLIEVWQAVEWWDSRDWSEQEVKEAIADFETNFEQKC
jgi:hypothetical protein